MSELYFCVFFDSFLTPYFIVTVRTFLLSDTHYHPHVVYILDTIVSLYFSGTAFMHWVPFTISFVCIRSGPTTPLHCIGSRPTTLRLFLRGEEVLRFSVPTLVLCTVSYIFLWYYVLYCTCVRSGSVLYLVLTMVTTRARPCTVRPYIRRCSRASPLANTPQQIFSFTSRLVSVYFLSIFFLFYFSSSLGLMTKYSNIRLH